MWKACLSVRRIVLSQAPLNEFRLNFVLDV
jgi:hypothetical protein